MLGRDVSPLGAPLEVIEEDTPLIDGGGGRRALERARAASAVEACARCCALLGGFIALAATALLCVVRFGGASALSGSMLSTPPPPLFARLEAALDAAFAVVLAPGGGSRSPVVVNAEAYSSVHVIPEGGALAVECVGGSYVREVLFASWGTPVRHPNGSVGAGKCHGAYAAGVVARACVNNSHCCLPVSSLNFASDPCYGQVKTLAVVLRGCVPPSPAATRYARHCSLRGQPLLCGEDVRAC